MREWQRGGAIVITNITMFIIFSNEFLKKIKQIYHLISHFLPASYSCQTAKSKRRIFITRFRAPPDSYC